MALSVGCAGNSALIICGLLFLIPPLNATVEVVLLDSQQITTAVLNWTTHVNRPEGSDPQNTGWNELSMNDGGQPVRVYSSCFFDSNLVDNWLRTPFISIGDAKSLYIEMTFTMRKCTNFADPTSVIQCKETFNLYYYQAERDFANQQMPSWDATTWTSVDKIAADHLYESTTNPKINTEVRYVPLEQEHLNGVYFAFQDEGACVTLIHITVFYKACPELTENYAFYPETHTGRDQTAVKKEGTCVANASPVSTPKYVCMSDGTWDIPQGGCECHEGYEGHDGTSCVECQRGYFKWLPGNGPCQLCPDHSYTDITGSSACNCINGYYRAEHDSKNSSCTQPPSKPVNLRIVQVTDTTLTLAWDKPFNTGGRTDITYRIECPDCDPSVMVSPRGKGFNSTSCTLSKLEPKKRYRIIIYAENGVSAQSGHYEFEEIVISTEAPIPEIISFRALSVGNTYITIGWELHDQSRIPVERFEILYSVNDQRSNQTKTYTKNMNFTFKDLLLETEYVFQVRGLTSKGWGDYTKPIYVRTGKTPFGPDEAPVPSIGIIIGAIVAVILCMAIAAFMIVLLLRRSRMNNDLKNADCSDSHYHHVIQCPPMEPHINGSMTAPLFQPSGSIKSYVDPHTYEDPNQAVREFTREIDSSHITIESVIGGGEFGDVCKGKLRVPARPEMSVAIKTLKPGATDKNRLDFLTEASIMGQFDDPNVIFLEGVVTKSHPIMIVTEYMANGSLDGFLKKNDGQFTVIQLVGMMRGVASGMRYLSDMGYVHRDLAARNILVNETLVCKVADFGLSREVDIDTTDGAYTTKGGKIPVRWTAPEAIAFRKFTSASDVWSYGVVMWEIISYGERPYWNWSNQDVIKAVEKGYRLPPPMDCPDAIHQLMLDTWQKERNNRPKFTTIVKNLDKLIRAPELLRKMAKPRPQIFADSTPPDMTNFATVEEWLVAIKMERYVDNFIRAGYTSMEQVVRITVKDLDSLQITLLGHQKKIMNSVQTLRAQLLGPQMHMPQMSEGFLV